MAVSSSDHPDADQRQEDPVALDDPRVIAALEEYQTALEERRPLSRRQVLERFPEIAAELQDCLEGMELLHLSGGTGRRPGMFSGAGEISDMPLGDFRLIRELGRGGMGIVYEAEQLSLSRRVALKVLPFAATLDPRQLQRFKHEAHAAACLHHGNIVPVYNVGCDRGVHYYAMQFIDGHTLADAIRQLREQKGLVGIEGHSSLDRNSTSPRSARLLGESPASAVADRDTAVAEATVGSQAGRGFFRQVARLGKCAAEALDHAHQVGVVHRDVKPANLMIDKRGQLWITDFGLARLETEANLTVTGDVVGTLRYMSPEQALGKRGLVDHRTDIYSLGATLYELITLEPVCSGSDRHELLLQIARDEVRPPRYKNRAVPRDLETILLKALAKSPEERYVTAQEMADDLGRFLDDQPIQARPPSLVNRLSRWARQHRTMAAGTLAILVVLTIGLGISNYLILQEQAETRRAYDAEARQRALAEENFQQARLMLDFFTQVTEEDLANYPQVQDIRRKLLAASLGYYQSFIEKSSGNPDLHEELGASHFRLALILNEMGESQKAVTVLEKALDLQEQLVRSNPKDQALRDTLATMYQHWGPLKNRSFLILVGDKAVQAEIKLTAQQLKEVGGLLAQYRDFFRKKFEAGRDGSVREADAFRASIRDQVMVALKPEQIRRVQQIAIQQRGVLAFKFSEVVANLKLSGKQRGRIDRLIRESSLAVKNGKSRTAAEKKAMKAAIELLTSEQRQVWDELAGPPFEGVIPGMRFPPGGFHPPSTAKNHKRGDD